MPTNPTHKDVSLLVERLRATEANCNFGSTLCARDAHAAADLLSRAQPAGLVEALATANIVEIVKDGRWSLSLKFRTAGEMRAASDAIRAALASSDSPVVGKMSDAEKADALWGANDMKLHGGRPASECPPGTNTLRRATPTDTADRREVIRKIIEDEVYAVPDDDRCKVALEGAGDAAARIASLIAGPPEGYMLVKRRHIEAAAKKFSLFAPGNPATAILQALARPTGES